MAIKLQIHMKNYISHNPQQPENVEILQQKDLNAQMPFFMDMHMRIFPREYAFDAHLHGVRTNGSHLFSILDVLF